MKRDLSCCTSIIIRAWNPHLPLSIPTLNEYITVWGFREDKVKVTVSGGFSRLSNLLLRISEFQPIAPPATLELLAQTIEQAEATADAGEATIRESKSDWNVP